MVYFNRQLGSEPLPEPLIIYTWWCIYQYTHTYTLSLFNTFPFFPLSDLTPMQTCRILPELAGVDSIATLFLTHNGMFSRIYFTHIAFAGVGFLFHIVFPMTWTTPIWYCISYSPFNYYPARWGRVTIHFDIDNALNNILVNLASPQSCRFYGKEYVIRIYQHIPRNMYKVPFVLSCLYYESVMQSCNRFTHSCQDWFPCNKEIVLLANCQLTHWGRVTDNYVSDLGHYWFR